MFYYRSAIKLARPMRRSDRSDRSPNRPRSRPSRPTMNGIMHFLLLHKRGWRSGRLCTYLSRKKFKLCTCTKQYWTCDHSDFCLPECHFLYIFASKESHTKGEVSQLVGQSVTNDTSTIGWKALMYSTVPFALLVHFWNNVSIH